MHFGCSLDSQVLRLAKQFLTLFEMKQGINSEIDFTFKPIRQNDAAFFCWVETQSALWQPLISGRFLPNQIAQVSSFNLINMRYILCTTFVWYIRVIRTRGNETRERGMVLMINTNFVFEIFEIPNFDSNYSRIIAWNARSSLMHLLGLVMKCIHPVGRLFFILVFRKWSSF